MAQKLQWSMRIKGSFSVGARRQARQEANGVRGIASPSYDGLQLQGT